MTCLDCLADHHKGRFMFILPNLGDARGRGHPATDGLFFKVQPPAPAPRATFHDPAKPARGFKSLRGARKQSEAGLRAGAEGGGGER